MDWWILVWIALLALNSFNTKTAIGQKQYGTASFSGFFAVAALVGLIFEITGVW